VGTVVFVRFLTFWALLIGGVACLADPPQNYYAAASGKSGTELRAALHNIKDDQPKREAGIMVKLL